MILNFLEILRIKLETMGQVLKKWLNFSLCCETFVMDLHRKQVCSTLSIICNSLSLVFQMLFLHLKINSLMSLPKKEKFQLDKKCSDTHESGTSIELISQKLLIDEEFVTFMLL